MRHELYPLNVAVYVTESTLNTFKLLNPDTKIDILHYHEDTYLQKETKLETKEDQQDYIYGSESTLIDGITLKDIQDASPLNTKNPLLSKALRKSLSITDDDLNQISSKNTSISP